MPLPSSELAYIGAPPLDDIIRRTKPRYHFSAGGGQPAMFWEREPFVWDDEEGRVSRFVSLGAFGGEPTPGKKQRVRPLNTYDCRVILNKFHLATNSGFMPSP